MTVPVFQQKALEVAAIEFSHNLYQEPGHIPISVEDYDKGTVAAGGSSAHFWNHAAVCDHEDKHRADYKKALNTHYELFETWAEGISVDIDCDITATKTCEGAVGLWLDLVTENYNDAIEQGRNEFDIMSTPYEEAEERAYDEVSMPLEQPISESMGVTWIPGLNGN